jgi:hypothetical protein
MILLAFLFPFGGIRHFLGTLPDMSHQGKSRIPPPFPNLSHRRFSMSLRIRRLAVVSLAAVALTAGGAFSASVSVSAPTAQEMAYPGPDGDGYPGHGHDRPPRFGPFEFPHRRLSVAALATNTRITHPRISSASRTNTPVTPVWAAASPAAWTP